MALPPAVAVGAIAAAVSLVTTIATILVAPSVKYAFDQRLENRKLDISCRFEQRKALKDHIARHMGRFLEAADSLDHRPQKLRGKLAARVAPHAWRLFRNSRILSGHLRLPIAFVFGQLFEHCSGRRCISTRGLATVRERSFLKAIRLNVAIWTDVRLFKGLDYDDAESTDHFFRDALNSMADSLFETDPAMSSTSSLWRSKRRSIHT
jgi:hypothetical protein